MMNFNLLLIFFLFLYLFRAAFQIYLNYLHTSHLRKKGGEVPEIFKDSLDGEKLKKNSSYNIALANWGLTESLFSQAFLLAILFSDFCGYLVKMIAQGGFSPIISGLIFWGAVGLLSSLWHIPFSLYENFGIEARYGFNTKTLRLWITDLLKGLFLSCILGGFLLYLILVLIYHGGDYWWFWAWLLLGSVELLVIFLYPILIAPWFNKFTPLPDEDLKIRINALLEKAGLKAKGIFQMDASRRSRHTNAYFMGLGKSKRIVLFDTLLKSHPAEEVLAVLAHEIGHWRKKHILKQLFLAEIFSLLGIYLLAKLLSWPLLYQTFGFPEPIPYGGLFLSWAFLSPLGYFLQPLGAAISRNFEREADKSSLELVANKEAIVNALKRLGADNLANLNPHPLFAWFYYSHPPLSERINYILELKIIPCN